MVGCGLRLLTVVAAIAWLAGCDEAPVTNVTRQVEDPWAFVQGAAGDGPLLVEIHGNPYDQQPQALAQSVTAAMEQAITWNAGARFTTSPDVARNSDLRMVLTLNGGLAIDGGRHCRGGGAGGGPLEGGRVEIFATLCDGPQVMVRGSGWITRTDGPSHPGFSRLVRQLTRDMLSGSDDP